MKKHIALLFLSLGFFTACDMVSGEGEGADNAVYMGNTNSSGVISMVVSNDKGGSSVITPISQHYRPASGNNGRSGQTTVGGV